MPDGEVYYEVMTMDEIRKAWSRSQTWGKDQEIERKGSTHDDFRQEMCKRTVINRACKKFINSSDDSSLIIRHFNRQDEVIEEAEVQEEIKNNANKEVLDIDYEEAPEDPEQIEGLKQKPEELDKEEQHEQLTLDATGTEGPGF
jgi:recombination protein RecT